MTKLSFWGGVDTVTGSNFMLDIPDVGQILVDCGMFQGGFQAHERNKADFKYDPKAVSVLMVTHAHIDHIGRIPKLVKAGFEGKIFSTPQTKEIAMLMLDDTVKILAEEARRHKDPSPLYKPEDVAKAFSLWETHEYHEVFEPLPTVSTRFLNAGHILGSAMVELTRVQPDGQSRKIIFTGDSGSPNASIVQSAEPVTGANYVIVDSTYGDRTHEPWEEGTRKLKDLVLRTIQQKGILLIPAFSLERTHIILYELNNMIEGGEVPALPVYLDAPMANRLTPIYERSTALFNEQARKRISSGDDIFNFSKLQIVKTSMESAMIEKESNPKIIIAGSGMSTGGRIPSHEIALLPDPKTTLLLTGFQAVGTLGRSLEDGAKEVMITGQKVQVRARVETIKNFSAHRDMTATLELLETAQDTIKNVFCVHGEPKSALFLAQRIKDYLSLDAQWPEMGKGYEVDF